jgi:hypothetical protein
VCPEGTPLLLAFFCLLLFPPLSLILSQLMSPLAPKVRPCIQILQLMSHDKHTFHPFSYIITFFIVKGSKISMIDIQIVFGFFIWCEQVCVIFIIIILFIKVFEALILILMTMVCFLIYPMFPLYIYDRQCNSSLSE